MNISKINKFKFLLSLKSKGKLESFEYIQDTIIVFISKIKFYILKKFLIKLYFSNIYKIKNQKIE